METRPASENRWFELFDEIDVEGGTVGVFPVKLQIPGKVNPDTYLMKYAVYKTDNGDCSSPVWPTSTTPYKDKQFYINVR